MDDVNNVNNVNNDGISTLYADFILQVVMRRVCPHCKTKMGLRVRHGSGPFHFYCVCGLAFHIAEVPACTQSNPAQGALEAELLPTRVWK